MTTHSLLDDLTARADLGKTRFGVVGCGSAALPVCEAMANLPETSLVRVQDINLDLARDLGERYGVPYTADLEELLGDDEIDAVYIAVPHYLLAGLAKRALEANKHTLVEKPMALAVSEIDELIVLAACKSRALGVFYQMRYASCFAQARELVRAGAVGEIIGARVQTLIDKKRSYWEVGYTGRSMNPWRGEKSKAGGGVTLMNTSHLLDALWYVTGLEIVRVSAEWGTYMADVEVEDMLAAVLRFDNGAVGDLFSGAHVAGATANEGIAIYGKRGTLRIPDPYSQEPLQVFLNEGYREIPAKVWQTIPRTEVNVFQSAVQAFARAAQSNQPPPINGQDARRVLKTVLGLYHAAEEHSTVEVNNERN